MSYKILFDPTSDKWALSDGEHYLEVPYWAREIIADEFERETRQLKADNDRLREQSERLFDKTLELATENSKLRELCKLCEREAENAKLRELVKDMCVWAYIDSDCDLEDRFADRMHDLGVEVDG